MIKPQIKKNITDILVLLFALFSISFSMIFIITQGDRLLDADQAAELVLAKLLCKNWGGGASFQKSGITQHRFEFLISSCS